MCLAVPVKLVEVDGDRGLAQFSGSRREVGLQLLDRPEAGDYVLLHAGFAIQKLDPQEALETLELLDEMAGLRDSELKNGI